MSFHWSFGKSTFSIIITEKKLTKGKVVIFIVNNKLNVIPLIVVACACKTEIKISKILECTKKQDCNMSFRAFHYFNL